MQNLQTSLEQLAQLCGLGNPRVGVWWQRLELATSGTKEVLVARLLQQQNLALSAAAAANVQ